MENAVTEKVKPALTPEEWSDEIADNPTHEWFELTQRHRAAALALYGQPFGFTREDVALIRDVIDEEYGGTTMEQPLRALADRISALLPPEANQESWTLKPTTRTSLCLTMQTFHR